MCICVFKDDAREIKKKPFKFWNHYKHSIYACPTFKHVSFIIKVLPLSFNIAFCPYRDIKNNLYTC